MRMQTAIFTKNYIHSFYRDFSLQKKRWVLQKLAADSGYIPIVDGLDEQVGKSSFCQSLSIGMFF